jgi:hypothetical protein
MGGRLPGIRCSAARCLPASPNRLGLNLRGTTNPDRSKARQPSPRGSYRQCTCVALIVKIRHREMVPHASPPSTSARDAPPGSVRSVGGPPAPRVEACDDTRSPRSTSPSWSPSSAPGQVAAELSPTENSLSLPPTPSRSSPSAQIRPTASTPGGEHQIS